VRAERDDLRRQLAEVRRQNARLWALAREDPLTGLANRRGLAAVWATSWPALGATAIPAA
jgi:GGDEF domain-containing protein